MSESGVRIGVVDAAQPDICGAEVRKVRVVVADSLNDSKVANLEHRGEAAVSALVESRVKIDVTDAVPREFAGNVDKRTNAVVLVILCWHQGVQSIVATEKLDDDQHTVVLWRKLRKHF